MTKSVFQLQCSCNHPPWGRVGHDSLSARLCAKTPSQPRMEIKPDEHYAEMWMGDYPMQPARSLSSGESLLDIIKANKEQLLGKSCAEKFDGVLPFLPKILSIAKALPLQIHPDKDLATKLHKKDPENNPDANHKPEIAIALGPFELFAGWKPLKTISALFGKVPELKTFVPTGTTGTAFDNQALRQICRNLLLASDESVRKAQEGLARVRKSDLGDQSYILELLPRLQQQYSKEDAGNLVALLTMNFLELNKGDSVYIPADAPHAYLSGDIVECMARSANVLNTGFCPRADRDSVDIFCDALTFSPHNSQEVMLGSSKSSKGKEGKTVVYAPPMSEFNILRTTLTHGEKESMEGINGPSVLFVTEGNGKMNCAGETFEFGEGAVFFIGCGVQVDIEGGEGRLDAWRAYAE